MEIAELLKKSRAIWGAERLSLSKIIVRYGKNLGDLCRFERNAEKDQATHQEQELKKELGNMIFSTIRWCDDLGYDPQECIAIAMQAQEKFARENKQR